MTDDPVKRKYGGMCIQRMTPDTWLEVIDREKEDPRGTSEKRVWGPCRDRSSAADAIANRARTIGRYWRGERPGRRSRGEEGSRASPHGLWISQSLITFRMRAALAGLN